MLCFDNRFDYFMNRVSIKTTIIAKRTVIFFISGLTSNTTLKTPINIALLEFFYD